MAIEILEHLIYDCKKGFSLEQICKKYGGQSLYIPKVLPDVKERIRKEFNGYNHNSLAYKYNVSERAVRRWCKEL